MTDDQMAFLTRRFDAIDRASGVRFDTDRFLTGFALLRDLVAALEIDRGPRA